MNITIRESFKNCIPSPSEAEIAQLEQNILAEGCLDPLTVWEDGDEIVLIDGHNRHEICTKHGIHFDTRDAYFDSESDARLWIIKHQLGRRNFTDYQRTVVALQLKSFFAEDAKANQSAMGGPLRQKSDEVGNHVRTDDLVANVAGVSRDTVRKVEKILAKGSDEVKAAVSSGRASISRGAAAADHPKEQQAAELAKPRAKKDKPVPAAAPVATPAPETEDDFAPSEDEIRASMLEAQAEQEFMAKLLASDDKLAAAVSENKRLNHELAAVKIARDGYMNKCNELMSLLKTAQNKLDRISRGAK